MTQLHLDPLEQSNSKNSFSPILRDVLTSLDVQLEEELLQYRRRRPIQNDRSPRAKKTQTQKTLDLISVSATNSDSPAPTTNETKSLLDPHHTVSTVTQQAIDLPFAPTGVQIPASPYKEPEDHSLGDPRELATPSTPGVVERTDRSPDDYLESSEALVKNLDRETSKEEPPANPTNKLLNPLGIGSILLLLVGASTLAYVAFNPSTIGHLSSKGLLGAKTSTNGENSSTKTSVVGSGVPAAPNLAKQEFVELNLQTLSTVSPRNSALSQTSENPRRQVPVNRPAPLPNAPGSSRLDLPSALIPPSIQSGVLPGSVGQPAIPTAAPRISPPDGNKQQVSANKSAKTQNQKPAAGKATAKPASPKENRYLVVTSYNGDRSLAQARKIVPDALVRQLSGGKAIQLSAFASESEAQKKVEALRDRGLSARIYRR